MGTDRRKIRKPTPAKIRSEDLQKIKGTSPKTETEALPRARPKFVKTLRVVNEMMAAGVIGRYAIGGAVGATFHLEPMPTMDVDISVAIHAEGEDLIITPKPIYDYLIGRGYSAVGESLKVEDWLVQFLPPTSPLVEEGIAQAEEVEVADEVKTFVLSAEHLVAIALQTGRAKDKARIIQFTDSGKLDRKRLVGILERHGLIDKWRDFEKQFLND